MNLQSATSDAPRKRRPRRPKDAPTHVVELPLTVTECDRHVLEKRFQAEASLSHGVQQEALRRLNAMWASPLHAMARAAWSRDPEEGRSFFKANRELFGLTEDSLSRYEAAMRNACWIGDHIGGRIGHVIVKRVLDAVERHSFGKAGRPKFKPERDFRTISCRQADGPMKLTVTDYGCHVFTWDGLRLLVRRKFYSESELHSLSFPALFCRIVRRDDTACTRYAVQVVVDGPAYRDREFGVGHVGIDMGPSTVAAVSWDGVLLTKLAQAVESDEAEIRRLSRKLDRSKRASNPDCFDKAGRFIKGRRIRHRSNTYKATLRKKRRKEERAAAHRRNEHGRLANIILSAGTTVHIEKVNYVGWQKRYGRSAARRAPGAFVAILLNKAVAAGGEIVQIDTWRAKLSQLDHTTQDHVKKPLSLRRHEMRDGSGVVVQRDIYSAFLALHCSADGVVDIPNAQAHWDSGACERLAVVSLDAEPAKAVGFCLPPRRTGEPVRRGSGSPRRSAVLATGAPVRRRRGGGASAGIGSLSPGHLQALALRESG